MAAAAAHEARSQAASLDYGIAWDPAEQEGRFFLELGYTDRPNEYLLAEFPIDVAEGLVSDLLDWLTIYSSWLAEAADATV